MIVYVGELRKCSLDYSNDPGVKAGATLTGEEEIVIVRKRGEEEVANVVQESPAIAIVDLTTVWWGKFDVSRGRYIQRGTVRLSNGELAKAEAGFVVE